MGLGCGCGCGLRRRNKKGRLGNWRPTKICFQRFIGRPEEYVADRWVLQSTVSSLLLHFILTFFLRGSILRYYSFCSAAFWDIIRFVRLVVAGSWYWFVVREQYYWLTADWCWFDVRKKHCQLTDKLAEQNDCQLVEKSLLLIYLKKCCAQCW